MILLGVDLGTTGVKCQALDLAGHVLGEHYIEYELIFTPEGYVEQDANLWWTHTKSVIRAALSETNGRSGEVAGISISSQGIAFVPVDRNGATLQNAYSWYDKRGSVYADRIAADYGAKALFLRTGRSPSSLVLPEVMWIRDHRPEVYAAAAHFLMPMDFILYRMTGVCKTDYSMASGTLCYDITRKEWIHEMFERYGIDEGKFPEIGCVGDPSGTILPDVARELGIPADVTVALGGQDQKMCATGAGIREGVLTVSLGTASAVSSETRISNADTQGEVACHGYERSCWMLESCISTAGAAQKWLKNIVLPDASYKTLDAEVAAAPVGANGVLFLPCLVKRPGERGQGAFSGLSLDVTRGELLRSAQEGIAYEIRAYVETHKRWNPAVRGADTLRVFGGGAKSAVWLQIIADVTGMRVSVPVSPEAGCLGAAVYAGIGAGIWKKREDAAFLQCEAGSYLPNAKNHAAYERHYRDYYQLYRTIDRP